MDTPPTEPNPFQDFLGTDAHLSIPSPPPWRKRGVTPEKDSPLWAPEPEDPEAVEDLADRAARHSFRDQKWELDVIRAALILRRPILVTGKPGVGKSSIAYVTAHYLGLGPVLRWNINSKSTVEDAVYRYDAVRRLEYYTLRQRENPGKDDGAGETKKRSDDPAEEGGFYRLGPLGTALLPRRSPRVLLIDEIDKSDLDLPDDLLHVLEEGEYEIPELARLNFEEPVPVRTADRQSPTSSIMDGKLRTHEFPLIFMTSNGERDFSSAFLRRCLRLQLHPPTQAELAAIVRKQLGAWKDETGAAANLDEGLLMELAKEFHDRMDNEEVTTDQLLNTFFVRAQHRFQPEITRAAAADTSSSPRPDDTMAPAKP